MRLQKRFYEGSISALSGVKKRLKEGCGFMRFRLEVLVLEGFGLEVCGR